MGRVIIGHDEEDVRPGRCTQAGGDDEGGIVLINSKMTDPVTLAMVIAQELGLALGLPLIDDRSSVLISGNLWIVRIVDDRALISYCAPG